MIHDMYAALLILLSFLLSACTPSEEYINIVVRYHGEADDAGAEVFIIAGKDKRALGTLRVGDRQRLRLIPGRAVVRADERRLRLRYYPEGRFGEAWPAEWIVPDLPMDESYRIAIDIHADGRVESRYCILPCKLPDQAKGLSP